LCDLCAVVDDLAIWQHCPAIKKRFVLTTSVYTCLESINLLSNEKLLFDKDETMRLFMHNLLDIANKQLNKFHVAQYIRKMLTRAQELNCALVSHSGADKKINILESFVYFLLVNELTTEKFLSNVQRSYEISKE
ncbi:CLUMA_CG020020, isoform A, partial [Clunio marinus]